jgi:UDP-N-acetylglucosamine 2-epimerase (non-hydrolysing)
VARVARRVACIFGTRPEAIKIAPVVLALRESELFEPVVVVTAQHRTMLDQVLTFFGIEPDHDLDLLVPGQTLSEITSGALTGLSAVLERETPEVVLVQGDTTTAFAGALAGYYHRLPVAHVEAGLRTGDRYSPFPEELNRVLVSKLANLQLAPTQAAAANLLAEGVAPSGVVVTGNTVVDALLRAIERRTPLSPPLDDLATDPRRVLLVTAHRRESWGERLRAIGAALADLALGDPELVVVFPIHRNATVRDAILPAVEGLDNVRVVEPLSYGEFVSALTRADLILTDSGGIQEEAPTLGKPVLVLRPATERPEAVHHGSSSVIGTDRAEIVAAVRRLLDDPDAYAAMRPRRNPYGDGRAAERCVGALAWFLGLGPRVVDFS